MDPAIFFGKSRVTRQTVKPKQSSTDEKSANPEVTTRSQKNSAKGRNKVTKLTASLKENIPEKKNTGKTPVRKAGKKDESVCEDAHPKRRPALQTRKVHFEENQDSTNRKEGPVYQNVRRSDVTGDPYNEYDFSFDENAEPTKKKKQRKTNTSKPKKKISRPVLWDPSKRPIAIKTSKPKSTKSGSQKLVNLPESVVAPMSLQDKTKRTNVAAAKGPQAQSLRVANVPLDKPKSIPTSTSVPPTSKTSNVLISASTSSQLKGPMQHRSQDLSSATQSLQTIQTTSEVQQKSKSPAIPPHALANSKTVTVPMNKVTSLELSSRNSTPSGEISSCFNQDDHFASTPVASSIVSGKFSTSLKTSSQVKAASRHQQPKTSLNTPIRSPAVFTISVRESPSFMEPKPDVVVTTPSVLSNALANESTEKITSTPVTRSKSASKKVTAESTSGVHTQASSSSPSPVAFSPTPVLKTPVKPSWLQSNESSIDDSPEMFSDLPRESVIPTRMFSTHRGTKSVPNGENVSKRKAPDFSPDKEQKVRRTATVKFSAPDTYDVEDYFGFDDEDPVFVPQLPKGPLRSQVARAPSKQTQSKPNLPIQKVQAILRGQLNITLPLNSTPRTIQTKLTDFVSSTPTSTPTRPVQTTQSDVLTPTPVPLFGEEQLDVELRSPYIQPSRRSYDRFRPGKRIACGDEVHSDDEGEGVSNGNAPTSMTSIPPEPKKKNRSYRKRKKPADAQLDAWASQIASHFEEVEEVKLEVA